MPDERWQRTGSPSEMALRARLRASDADREHVAERLRQAAAEGRLLTEELEVRLGTALSARTYGELDAVVSDLPAPSTGRQRRASAPARPRPAAVALALVAAMLLITAVGAAIGAHAHSGHDWGGGSLIWLVWVALAWRYFTRRRGGAR